MPTFSFTSPDGKSYSVNGPDGATPEQAFQILQSHLSSGPPPDKYQQAAQSDIGAVKAAGGDEGAGLTRRLAHGATLGADSTILAGLETPLEMVKRGTFNPAEGYRYAKAREDQITGDARQNTGALGAGAEMLGGAVTGGGLANAGVTAGRFLAPNAGLIARAGASAADAAGLGGISGAMEGNGLQERAGNAAGGVIGGALVGAGLPLAGKLVGAMGAPIFAHLQALKNPAGFAEGQVARAIHESGVSPDDLSLRAIQAANEGQPQFTLADAMGNSGQRMLSTVARAPGEGRTAVFDALDRRQGDQGRRLASALQEGFDAPRTAEQTRAAMAEQASKEAAVNYAPVKSETQPIDVSRPVALANRSISPAADMDALAQGRVPTDLAARAGVEGQESVIADPIKSAVKQARSYLAAPELTSSNVHMAFRAKTNIDQMIASATEKGQGGLVAELAPIRDALDAALANTSKNYSAARDAYRIAQTRLEALDLGKQIGAKPVRSEDAIRQFNALPDTESQQAFRVGYSDPQIAQVQSPAFGTNKARPFTSDATRDEFNAIAAPGRADMMQRRLGREMTMFETRNTALGGSKTADNLNDHAAMGVDPHLVGQILTGNWHGAVRSVLSAGHTALTGNTAQVRREVANILLQNGGNISAQQLRDMVNRTVQRIQFVQSIARNVGRGASGGLAVAIPSISGGANKGQR
jgi:hypothetical protein